MGKPSLYHFEVSHPEFGSVIVESIAPGLGQLWPPPPQWGQRGELEVHRGRHVGPPGRQGPGAHLPPMREADR